MAHFGSCTEGIFLLLVLVVNPDDKTARRGTFTTVHPMGNRKLCIIYSE